MRRFLMTLCFLGGVVGVLMSAGCGDSGTTPTGNTAPTPKQLEKEGKSGGAMKGKGQ